MSWNRIALLLIAAMALPARVLAAGDGHEAPDTASVENAWIKWICLGVAILAIGAAGFKNPKRTHLD